MQQKQTHQIKLDFSKGRQERRQGRQRDGGLVPASFSNKNKIAATKKGMSWWDHTSKTMGGEGDTYFQQLAVLEAAGQKKNTTKDREAEIKEGLQQI